MLNMSVSKFWKIFTGPTYKLLLNCKVISDFCRSFIRNKTALTKYCLIRCKAVSGKLHGSDGHDKCNCSKTDCFHGSRVWIIVLFCNTAMLMCSITLWLYHQPLINSGYILPLFFRVASLRSGIGKIFKLLVTPWEIWVTSTWANQTKTRECANCVHSFWMQNVPNGSKFKKLLFWSHVIRPRISIFVILENKNLFVVSW